MNSILENAYTEVNCILELLGEQYIKKVPQKVLDVIYSNKNENYKFDLNLKNEISKINISRNALIIISILNLKYWEENDSEKLKLKNVYDKNEQVYQAKINRYKNDNWLNKDIEKTSTVKETNLIVMEDNTIWNKIKMFIKKSAKKLTFFYKGLNSCCLFLSHYCF